MTGRFAPKTTEPELLSDVAEIESDVYMETPYFTLREIELHVASAKRRGIDPKNLKFRFGQRFDLSSNPFDLCATGPVTGA